MSDKGKFRGASFDSLLLALVKFFTLASGLIGTVVLSHSLSLRAYGTYSQGIMIVMLGADLTILGLADSVNYFYNRKRSTADAELYVRTAVSLQVVLGVGLGVLILLLQSVLVGYFDNPMLQGVFIYLAFRPLLLNLGTIFQVLMVSVGRARSIAVRNGAFSTLKLAAIFMTAYVTSDIGVLFAILLGLDAISILWFWLTFRRYAFTVWPVRWRVDRIRDILSFSLPMALYVACSSLSRQFGALVIARNESTANYAIYANASILLPLDVITSSFLTVVIPTVTRLIAESEWDRARVLFKHYLTIGYLTTMTFAVVCMVLAEEIILVLYGERYLPGVTVFRIYLVSSMIRFAGFSLILSAAGRSAILMRVSLVSLAANAVMSVVGYQLIGFEGPAAATVVVNFLTTMVLLRFSAKQIHASAGDLFDRSSLLRYAGSLVLVVLLGSSINWAFRDLPVAPAFTVAVVAIVCVALVFVLSRRSLMAALRGINRQG